MSFLSGLHLKSNFLANRPVAANGAVDYLADFHALWTRLARARLDGRGKLVEKTDRYQQALIYQSIERQCFAEAYDRE